MRRISTLQSERDIDMERHREELRDIRWARWRSELRTAGALIGTATLIATGTTGQIVQAIRAFLGL